MRIFWGGWTRGNCGDEQVLDAAFQELRDIGESDVVRERIATRIYRNGWPWGA
jgi:polysaccharide pyruvyl transferase WcaK-like protein